MTEPAPAELVAAFVEAPSWAASERMVTDFPWLLSDEADRVIAAAAGTADAATARAYEVHRALLADARRLGVAAAFRDRILDGVPEALHEPWLAAARSSERYLLDRGDDDLDDAIRDLAALLADPRFTQAPADRRALMAHALGTASIDRYSSGGAPADLDRAIEAFRVTAATAEAGDPERPDYLAAVGNALAMRHDRTGDLDDLRGSIEALRDAIGLLGDDDPLLAGRLGELAASCGALYDITGGPEHLAEAIETARRAVAVADRAPDEADRAALLNNLVNCLVLRYERSGDLGDLRAAAGHAARAVRIGADEPYLPVLLTTLGSTLLLRYERDNSVETLDRAVDALDRAAATFPPGSPDWVICVGALGNARLSRFEQTGDRRDLDDACADLAGALDRVDPGTPRAGLLRGNLGQALLHRHALSNAGSDLQEALDALEGSVASSAGTPRILPFLLTGLGEGHRRAYAATGDRSHLARGVEAYRDACAHGRSGQFELALTAGRQWGRWAAERHDWPEAGEAYEEAMSASERLLRTQFDRADKEIWLGAAMGLPAAAAQAHERGGRPRDAVLAIERGRGQLLSEALRGELAVRAPEAARRFRECNERLRQLRWAPPLWSWSEDLDAEPGDAEQGGERGAR
jgi:tetratricopeptide (TPR) repeat protein